MVKSLNTAASHTTHLPPKMPAPKPRNHTLNEAKAPVSDDVFGSLAKADPADAVEIARSLPLENRARLAAFCYARRHTNHLGLLIASTCDRMALRRAMGMAGDILFQQSRNVEKTLAASLTAQREAASKISLAGNIIPLSARRK